MRILAIIHDVAMADQRTDSRRPVNLNASFRVGGTPGIGCVVSNISIAGFMAKSYAPVDPGSEIWLRVPGFDAVPARVIWAEDGRIGCQFEPPLDPHILVRIVADAPNLH